MAPEVSTPVPAARRRRPRTRAETSAVTIAPESRAETPTVTTTPGTRADKPAATTAPESLDTAKAQRDTPPPAAPPSGGGVTLSSGILAVRNTTTAALSLSSGNSEDDEVETMRWHADDGEDQLEPASDGGAFGSLFAVSHESSSDGRRVSSVVAGAPGGVGAALDGPFNSTMVEGAVPIHQMPPLHMTPVRGPSTRTPVPDINDEDTVTDVPQPLPCPPPPPESPPNIPPCPLGLYRQMQLREMRRHGVLYSWQLPQP